MPRPPENGVGSEVDSVRDTMDRTVPRTGSEEIELYIRTYYSLLRSTTDVRIRTMEEIHSSMNSSLHPLARSEQPDISALVYSSLRLPACVVHVERIILGQNQKVFLQRGNLDVESWQPVAAKARRRRSFYDGDRSLACYIASRSDIDDMIPILTAYQIEWNKIHRLLQGDQVRRFLDDPVMEPDGIAVLAHGLGLESEELDRLANVWGDSFWETMKEIAEARKDFRIRLLASSLSEYRRGTQSWWEQVETALPSITDRPVYFVSSNTHSIVNLTSGFALRHEPEILEYLRDPGCEDLLAEWTDIEARAVPSSRENFLYYALKKYLTAGGSDALKQQKLEEEREGGILRVTGEHGFDVEVQLIELNKILPDRIDPRLAESDLTWINQSDAVIVNIDYPLGMAAYLILSHLASRVGDLRGVYIMGKAASLNGVLGDVMIPIVVHDEHSQNTYLFRNAFTALDLRQPLVYGTVLDNQKAVSVRGTFLQTPKYMDVFYREGYTDIEMEAGPYLSAVYEIYRPKRYPDNEIVDLHAVPFDIGILHYASDTPFNRGLNLGAGSMSYHGMDPTYSNSITILRRVFSLEQSRMLAEAGASVPVEA